MLPAGRWIAQTASCDSVPGGIMDLHRVGYIPKLELGADLAADVNPYLNSSGFSG